MSRIDPFVYIATYFDLLKNQVDTFALEHEILVERHCELINIIKKEESETIERCIENFVFLQHRLDNIIAERTDLFMSTGLKGSKEYVEKNLEIRNE